MTELLATHHLLGLLIGASTFLIIGFFHPVVVKSYYHFGTRCWWWFLMLGIVSLGASLVVTDVLWSSLLGVLAFSSFWTIKEIFEQRDRVAKGWFPDNPRRVAREQARMARKSGVNPLGTAPNSVEASAEERE